MNRVAFSPLDHLSPEISKQADTIAAELIASLNRARDHVLDPARHKLPAGALEQKLARNLAPLKARLRGAAPRPTPVPPAKAHAWPRQGPTREQVLAELDKIWAGDTSILAQGGVRAIASPKLNINKLSCVQDTLEPGKDEMAIGTVATRLRVLDDGTIELVTSSKETALGDFKKDTVATFDPARTIASFDAIETPATLSVHLVLAETDPAGGLQRVLKDLLDGLENRLNGKQLTAIFASATGLVVLVPAAMSITGAITLVVILNFILGMALVVLCAAVVAALILAIAHMFRDEIFATQVTSLSLDAAGGVNGGTVQPIPLRFSRQVAVYDAEFQWQPN